VVTTRSSDRAGPGAPHVDEPHAPIRTLADPARDRLVAATGRDHQVGPGRTERAGALPIHPCQRARERPVDQRLPARVGEALDLEGPAQRLAECQHLGVVAGPMGHQQPDAGHAPGHTGAARSAAAGECVRFAHRVGCPRSRIREAARRRRREWRSSPLPRAAYPTGFGVQFVSSAPGARRPSRGVRMPAPASPSASADRDEPDRTPAGQHGGQRASVAQRGADGREQPWRVPARS